MSPSRIRVDTAALAANYRYLRKRSRADCAGVVKADAYGLGLEPVVNTLRREGCEIFFVATLNEALAVRALSSDIRVLLLAGVHSAEAAAAVAQARIEPVLNSPAQLTYWRPHAALPAAIHFDTGIERLGIAAADFERNAVAGFELSLIMTHLACADEPAHAMNLQQLKRFQQLAAQFPGMPTSIANSAGCLLPPDWHGDVTRPGIGLYGGHPQNRIADNPLTAVVQFSGQVVQRRSVSAGTGVGYGASFVAQRTTELAVIGLGYADGLPRVLSNLGQATVAGVRAPIVGKVSMDLVHLDVTELEARPEVGDWVDFLGADIGVDEMAQWAGTIGLEVLCSLGGRPQREYFASV